LAEIPLTGMIAPCIDPEVRLNHTVVFVMYIGIVLKLPNSTTPCIIVGPHKYLGNIFAG